MAKREDILASGLATKVITLEQWGEVTIRRFSSRIRDKIDEALHEASTNHNYSKPRALAVVHSFVGEDGQLMFSEADLEPLSDLDGQVLDQAFGQIAIFNGMTSGSIKDAEKN